MKLWPSKLSAITAVAIWVLFSFLLFVLSSYVLDMLGVFGGCFVDQCWFDVETKWGINSVRLTLYTFILYLLILITAGVALFSLTKKRNK